MANLSDRYAYALFRLALESGKMQEWHDQVGPFALRYLKQEGGLKILTHPLISSAEKNAFVDKVFTGHVNEHIIGFLKLAIAKNREAFIYRTLTKLFNRIKLELGIIRAKVISAVKLTPEQEDILTKKLSQRFGKQVLLYVVVDPARIAGMSIQVDGYYLDRTAKTLLRNMKERII